ncbi:hypothetical protein HWV62_2948 [Athelia sp. TMB]|nr:hypothetical protein HWV62_2948 [Athelia sp. TMB]
MGLPTPPHSGSRVKASREKSYKLSTPIQIPTRDRSLMPPNLSPHDRPRSPDLIFEMSPIDPSPIDSYFAPEYRATFVQRTLKHKASSSASLSKSPQFMYTFPRPKHSEVEPLDDHFVALPSPDSHRRMSSDQSSLQRSYFTSAFGFDCDADSENSPESPSQSCIHSTCSRGRSRRLSTNVSGRFSALASPASVRIRERSRRPMSPAPSLLWSGGENGKRGGDFATKETHFCVDEAPLLVTDAGYEKHVMRRTEDEKRVGRARRGRAGSILASTIKVVVESY